MRNCDYCGTELQLNEPNSDSYVVTIEHKIFCIVQTVGEEPIKDCLEDYIRSKKNVRKIEKEKEQRRLQGNEKNLKKSKKKRKRKDNQKV